jgi:hypothetical protein
LQLARLVVGYGAIASALPYLALKLVWLAGGGLGVADPRMMREPSMVALNVLTAGMDLVAIGIALAFTHEWGMKIPAWLVLPPMWVATGLLAKFVAAVPIVFAVEALWSNPIGRPVVGPVQPWVYTVVYAGFVGIGAGLMLAFILYARLRWGDVFEGAQRSWPQRTRSVQGPLAAASATMAVAIGGLHLAWAFGAEIGVPAELAAERRIASSLINALDAGLMVAGAAGVLMMVHGIGRRVPFWIPLTLAWVGGAFLFAWAVWHMIVVLGNTPLARGSGGMALVNIAALVRLIAGLVIGVVMLFVVAERAPGDAPPVGSG